jgi:phosphatidate cytidylyltransferase
MANPTPNSTSGAAAAADGGRRKVGADLPSRIAAGGVMIAAALAAAWAGGLLFLAFWIVAAAAALWEWQTLIGGERLALRLGLGALTLLVGAALALGGFAWAALGALALGALAAGLAAGSESRARRWAGAGVLYAAALAAAPSLLRGDPTYGLPAILWLFAVVWMTDIMAYFGGRLIGGPKLWPRVSPGKTWSGALVGGLAGAACGAAVGLVAAPAGARFAPLVALGLAASIVAQLGDLFESAVKRRFHVKDSSHLIPGHGGVMDRLDGFVAAATFAALIGWARAGGDGVAAGLMIRW